MIGSLISNGGGSGGPPWSQHPPQINQAKIAQNGTAPRRELNSEGVAVLKMAPISTKNPSEMDTNIDQNSDHILT